MTKTGIEKNTALILIFYLGHLSSKLNKTSKECVLIILSGNKFSKIQVMLTVTKIWCNESRITSHKQWSIHLLSLDNITSIKDYQISTEPKSNFACYKIHAWLSWLITSMVHLPFTNTKITSGLENLGDLKFRNLDVIWKGLKKKKSIYQFAYNCQAFQVFFLFS